MHLNHLVAQPVELQRESLRKFIYILDANLELLWLAHRTGVDRASWLESASTCIAQGFGLRFCTFSLLTPGFARSPRSSTHNLRQVNQRISFLHKSNCR